MPSADIATLISSFGLPAAALCLVLILSGVLVTKGRFQDMKEDRDRWRTQAEKMVEAMKNLEEPVKATNEAVALMSHIVTEWQQTASRIKGGSRE